MVDLKEIDWKRIAKKALIVFRAGANGLYHLSDAKVTVKGEEKDVLNATLQNIGKKAHAISETFVDTYLINDNDNKEE